MLLVRARRLEALKRAAIAVLVVVHFSLGLLCTIPALSHFWTIPLLRTVRDFYTRNRLDQSWSMFAPPPRLNTELQYAVEFADGWSDLVPLQALAQRHVKGTLVQPRGVFRLATFFRATATDQIPGGLKPNGERVFYFQQVADYFCAGDGKIPGAITIRFYLLGRRTPYFFETDQYGRPQPPIRDFDFQQPLYEQACTQP